MRIKVTETGKIYDLTLRVWSDLRNQYGPDCFGDLEISIPGDYAMVDGDAYMMPQADLDATCDWWRRECSEANADPEYEGDGLCGAHRGDEYCFFCEEVD